MGRGWEREERRERGRGERMEGMVRGGGGGKREGGKGGTNWSRDCTLQKPLSTVAVSSTSCGRSHMIPTCNSPVKDYSVFYFDYITKYSVRSTAMLNLHQQSSHAVCRYITIRLCSSRLILE